MTKLLHKTKDGFLYWCPGCKHAHQIWTQPGKGACWDFNGNHERPTFNPSVRHFTPADVDCPEETTCHYFIRDGIIQYCEDSAHHLAGCSVPMEPIPGTYNLGSTIE